jgi:uncharacterized protein
MYNSKSNRLLRFALAFLALPMANQLYAADFIVPELRSPIVDDANFLPSATRSRLEQSLSEIHDSTGLQIAALIVPNLSEVPIESVGIRVTEKWKLGSKKHDKGALLLIAVAEKQIRIEVGQGLEGELTDALAKRIISERIAPLISGGDNVGAVTVGLYSIAQAAFPDQNMRVYFDREPLPASPHPNSRPLTAGELAVLGILLFLALFTRTGRSILFFALMTSGRGGGSSGGGSRGGGYGGGGGGFSGGGASGGW